MHSLKLTIIVSSLCLFVGNLVADDLVLKQYREKVQPVVKQLCFKCHQGEKAKGDFRMDTLNPDMVAGEDQEAWHDALNRFNQGEMPPAKAKQATTKQRELLTAWISRSLEAASHAKRYTDGRVVTRRLTRQQYQNTMEDLLGVQLDFSRYLPPDPASPDGFLNNGLTLEMSPVQLETMLQSARAGLQEAIVSGSKPKIYQTSATKTAVGKMPQLKVAGVTQVAPEFILDIKQFPREGQFEIHIQAGAVVPAGEDFPRLQLWLGCLPGIVHVPRKLVGEVNVTATVDQPQEFVFTGRMEDFPQSGDQPFGNVAFKGMMGLLEFVDADGKQLRHADKTYAVPPSKKKPKPKSEPKKADTDKNEKPSASPEKDRLDIIVSSISFQSPVFSTWPPASHQGILFERDPAVKDVEYAREVIARFMRRAYRRMPLTGEIENAVLLFEKIQKSPVSFEEAMRETLASMLISPHFLYLVETRTADAADSAISNFELASRLSYFLWNTMPDETLMQLAEAGKLKDKTIIEQQVQRMLADPRSVQFAESLADQWFDLDALNRVAVNPEFYPDFDNRLKLDMQEETRQFMLEILQSDSSCLQMIESDWTMLNRPLAKFYGITGPRTTEFERVALPTNLRRGGLLGQASFLLSNSDGQSSHPIKRAVWILDRLLDTPPAPPPPDVPELNPEIPDLAGLSLKQQLVIHREKEACYNCHKGIDPWGIPLEHFNAIGQWEATSVTTGVPVSKKKPRATVAVDSSTMLPDDTKTDGATELKQYLLEHRRTQFARSVVTHVATYALGRSLDYGDDVHVERLTEKFIESDYRLSSLLVALAQSELFQTK